MHPGKPGPVVPRMISVLQRPGKGRPIARHARVPVRIVAGWYFVTVDPVQMYLQVELRSKGVPWGRARPGMVCLLAT